MANHNPPTNGFDKRPHAINRKGRPKSFDQLRALAQKLSHETVGESTQTAVELILRKLAMDKPERFLEIAYGKVPQPIEMKGEINTKSEVVFDYGRFINTARRPVQDSEPPSQDEDSLHGQALG